ncbi:MAG TPA: BMP family ABC transporter substrate-binding protein, partial [Caldimonas sp.]|nr:BMP family ABC transporter substrate-binding protein [Caldimonas sp.]
MNRFSRRACVRVAGWATLAALTALAGCSKKEETTTSTEATPAGSTTTTTTTTTTGTMSASAPATAASGPLKVAFAYVGPVGDGGWTFAQDNARKALQAALGDKIQTSFVEKVPEGADAERVFRDMASQGNKLIFGTTFGYMEPML